jgi:hypothetical protein
LRNVSALAINPRNPEVLYAGTPAGIFQSTNGAESWRPTSVGSINSAVNALVVHSRRPSVVYAGASGGRDAFVAVLDASGRPRYGSFLGGSSGDEGQGIAVGPGGSIVIAGETKSFDFAGVSRRSPGDSDGFVARIRLR